MTRDKNVKSLRHNLIHGEVGENLRQHLIQIFIVLKHPEMLSPVDFPANNNSRHLLHHFRERSWRQITDNYTIRQQLLL
jgi:hypothetical protein